MSEVLAQERFDGLAEKLLAMAEENGKELMGAHNITQKKIGEKTVRFSIFMPKDQRLGYSPSIFYQELKGPDAEDDYWAPLSEVYLLRDRLDDGQSDEQLTQLEAALKALNEPLDILPEVSG